jgi:hypothetical protein
LVAAQGSRVVGAADGEVAMEVDDGPRGGGGVSELLWQIVSCGVAE